MAKSAQFISSVDLDSFFQEVFFSFQSAAVRPVDLFYRIAGLPVRLCFAHKGLCKHLTRSLAHLEETKSSEGAFTIYILDTASSGQKLKAPEWLLGGLSARGELLLPPNTSYHVVLNTCTSILSMYNKETNCAIFFAQDIEKLPPWEIAAPFISLFHLFVREYRIQVVHAAAVGHNDKAALVVGPGGAGKSTTAISCLFSGLSYLGDDYTAVSLDPPYSVYSLYCSGKLTPFSLGLLEMPEKAKTSPAEQKALLFFEAPYKHLLAPVSQLHAIILPSIGYDQAPSYSSIHPAEALRSFVPSCITQLPYSDGELFIQMAPLVRSLACFKVNLGPNPKANAQIIHQILEQT